MTGRFITIQEALDKEKGEVNIRGWVYRERGSAKVKFVVLRDGTNIVQCVIKKESVGDEMFKTADSIQIETSMSIRGIIKKDERAPTGYEVEVKEFKIIGECNKFPITKDQSPEFLLDIRHLSLRSRRLTAVFKIRNTVMQAFREYYLKQGFIEWSPPILQPIQCEGGSTLFEVKYYNEKTFLTQSWQLYAEAGIYGYEKIFCISPCFRAERSKTSRHLSEFWMAEVEAAWWELPELMDSIEGCICYIVEQVLKRNKEDLKLLNVELSRLSCVKKPLPRITYTDALKLIENKEGVRVEWGKDLRTIEEDMIMKHFDKPLLVTHYPKEVMAFYKPPAKDNEKVALCVDVLAPEGYGEIVGGSQRDMNIERMKKLLKEQGEDPKKYEWYFDTRRYGGVPHSGFGLGIDRLVSWICKLDNIKDTIPFPRTMLRWRP